MQPISAPIWRDIASMAPDRALLHSAHGLPNALAAVDLFARVDNLAGRGLDRRWNWRFGLVDLGAEIEQRPEHDDHGGSKNYPKPRNRKLRAVVGHGKPPSIPRVIALSSRYGPAT